jgi:RNA polymerase sigma-70 factor (ECF subfamily)
MLGKRSLLAGSHDPAAGAPRDANSAELRLNEGLTVRDERQLVAEAASGSVAAGEELFSRHWLAAWRLAFSVTGSAPAADDVAQDAFERAFRGLASFNGRSSFRTWLSRIVVNRAIDLARRESRFRPLEPAETAPSGWSHEEVGGDRDLFDAVLALPLERRTAVVLRYWASHTPPEIAEILGVPLGTVHSRLGRALAELRSRLEETDVHRA